LTLGKLRVAWLGTPGTPRFSINRRPRILKVCYHVPWKAPSAYARPTPVNNTPEEPDIKLERQSEAQTPRSK
jgi:hypothetical protein